MSSVILTGDTSGTLTLSAPLVAGSNTVTLPAATGTVSLLTQATSVSASGTSVDFTGIPSWAKRITVMLSGVSTSGTSIPLLQLGDSGGIENTGYLGAVDQSGSPVSSGTTGFGISRQWSGTYVAYGRYVLELFDATTNTWIASWSYGGSGVVTAAYGGGNKSLSGTLDRIRLTTVNGTDTFDAGTINIMYEG